MICWQQKQQLKLRIIVYRSYFVCYVSGVLIIILGCVTFLTARRRAINAFSLGQMPEVSQRLPSETWSGTSVLSSGIEMYVNFPLLRAPPKTAPNNHLYRLRNSNSRIWNVHHHRMNFFEAIEQLLKVEIVICDWLRSFREPSYALLWL